MTGPRTKAIVLGGRTYEVAQKSMRANKEWRDSLEKPFLELVYLLEHYDQALEIKTAADLARVVGVVKDLVLGSMTLLLNALFAYSPVLAHDREWIEENAYDDEALEALAAIVGLAYPLDRMLTIFRGGPLMPTSTNSPLPNGDSGTKVSRAGRRATT